MSNEGVPVVVFDIDGNIPEPPKEEVVKDERPAPSEHETRARSNGWMNKEEWVKAGNSEEEHVSAFEFNRAGDLISRIKSQSSEIGNLRTDLDARAERLEALETTLQSLVTHNKKLAESQVKQTRSDLYKERAEAIVEQDPAKVAELDEALDELKRIEQDSMEIADKTKEKELEDQDDKVVLTDQQYQFAQWVDQPENEWFQKDPGLRGAFLGIGDEVARELGENSDLTVILDTAKKELVRRFPGSFQGAKPPPGNKENLEGDGDKSSDTHSINDLSDEQRMVARRFEAEGVMSVKEYIEQLAATGELD
jgi:regulator of replication initiation timing